MAPNRLIRRIVLCLCVVHSSLAVSTIERKVCQSNACYKSAARMDAFMDTTADPCQDFHQYACGKFLREAQITHPQESVGSFYDLIDSDTQKKKDILESPMENFDRDGFEWKMKTFYKSCMDTDSIKLRGLKDYNDAFREDWPTLNSKWTDTSHDFQKAVKKYLTMTTTEALIKFGPGILYSNGEGFYRLHIDQPEVLVPEYEISNDTRLAAYKGFYVDLAIALGANNATAIMDAEKVLSFTKSLHDIRMSLVGTYDPEKTIEKTTLEKMNSAYPYLDWVSVVSALFHKMGLTFDASSVVNVASTKYLTGLATVLKETDKRTVQNYMAFMHAINVYDENQGIRNVSLDRHVRDEGIPRFVQCVNLVDGLYNTGMAKLMARTRFSPEAKKFMDAMVEHIRESYRTEIGKQMWMDEATKQKALLKLQRMSSHVGVQNVNFTEKDIDQLYKAHKVHSNAFIADKLQNSLQGRTDAFKLINKRISEDRWLSSMTVVNAYYQPSLNTITFPLGILQPPLFAQDQPSYNNYGAIGAFISHEIGHAFDTNGRKYDERGEYRDWWTPETERKYKEKAQCYIDQYSRFTIEQIGVKINGSHTAPETIADNLGMSQVIRAYRKYEESNPDELPLPLLGLTKEQLLFLSFGQVWCLQSTDLVMKYVATTRYPDPKSRANGVLQNNKAFSDAFQCKTGDYMNPAKKCSMW